MASKPFRTYNLQLSIDHNTGEMFINLPHSLEKSINPRDLQDLLPRFAKAAPYRNRANKVTWKIPGVDKLVPQSAAVVNFHDGSFIRKATRADKICSQRAKNDGSDLGVWIDEDGHKLYIKEA